MFQTTRNRTRPTVRLRASQLEDRCVPANFVPVINSLNATLTTNTGSTVQLTGTFTDIDANDPHSTIIDWHDGSSSQETPLTIGARNFQLTHFYPSRQVALDSIRSISVIVTDQAFADQVVATSGTFNDSDFRNPEAVLGEPTRFTSPSSPYGGAVTPFNPPFGGDEILSLYQGESVTVKFPVKVYDNPISDHSGADFLVFGNAFYNFDFNTLKATGGVFAEPGQIELSQDGVNFFPITSAFADTAFPTNGYQNPTGPFDPPPTNAIPSDFGLPVNLSFNETGLTLAQIVAAYNGSGGGTPVDISSTGLPWIQYVRVSGAAGGVEVDAMSVVNPLPAPTPISSLSLSQIDATLGLYAPSNGFFQGANGVNNKWLLSSVRNSHGNFWYFIHPNGDVLAWNGKRSSSGGMVAAGTVEYRLEPDVFVHPATLYDASDATLSPANTDIAQNLDESLGLFVGTPAFRNGTISPTFKWLRGKVNALGSTWYYINSNGDLYAWNGSKKLLIQTFEPQLYLDPQLLYNASQATLSPTDALQAQQLDQTLGLFVDAAGVYPNVQNTNAKWLRGQPNASKNVWYFIRDNGQFVAWDGETAAKGKKIATGTVLYQFDPQVFLDPQLLYDAAQSTLSAGQSVEAKQLEETLGLFIDAKGLFTNVHDTSAKWLRGQTNQFGTTWYFIRPDGELVAWNKKTDSMGRKVATGTVLYQFDRQVFLNLEVLL
jgi:hypothetical protein